MKAIVFSTALLVGLAGLASPAFAHEEEEEMMQAKPNSAKKASAEKTSKKKASKKKAKKKAAKKKTSKKEKGSKKSTDPKKEIIEPVIYR